MILYKGYGLIYKPGLMMIHLLGFLITSSQSRDTNRGSAEKVLPAAVYTWDQFSHL